jgi:hypothetical protein
LIGPLKQADVDVVIVLEVATSSEGRGQCWRW